MDCRRRSLYDSVSVLRGCKCFSIGLFILFVSFNGQAQEVDSLEDILSRVPSSPPGLQLPALPDESVRYGTGEGVDIEVSVVARGFNHPWGFVSLPDGTLFVGERNTGHLRVIRNDVLDPLPVEGMPEVMAAGFSGLHDIILHPDFEDNSLMYITYNKLLEDETSSMTIMRGAWDGESLTHVEDIFTAGGGISGASRILFDNDGLLYMSLYGSEEEVQDLSVLNGKVLRLTDEGGVPDDNPFVNTAGARPEVFTVGHRTIQGLALHPLTGEVWAAEMGPNGGDEVNILKAGANYGWPYVSLGRDYAGEWQGQLQQEGYEDPVVYWMPGISVSGMVFYTGDKVPEWRGDLFLGGLRMGQIPGTGQVQRIRLNALDQEIRREVLLGELRFRMRGAYQGMDGYLYVLTDEDDGALLRVGAVSE